MSESRSSSSQSPDGSHPGDGNLSPAQSNPAPSPHRDAHSPREEGKVQSRDLSTAPDISALLSNWNYEPGTISVRTIVGGDGSHKLQMRVELGLLQMEVSGRPDGARPYGHESLLEYFDKQLEEYGTANGSNLGFHLTRPQCEALRHEAAMYYQRYLSLFALEDFAGVMRDTSRNLRVLDLCGKFAVEEQDRLWLEQYRPYIIMMYGRAKSSLQIKEGKTAEAYRSVKLAMRRIREFFEKFQQPDAFKHSTEVKVLKKLARELKKKLPVDPLKQLQKDLDRAVQAERYEEAARLRDQIAKLG